MYDTYTLEQMRAELSERVPIYSTLGRYMRHEWGNELARVCHDLGLRLSADGYARWWDRAMGCPVRMPFEYFRTVCTDLQYPDPRCHDLDDFALAHGHKITTSDGRPWIRPRFRVTHIQLRDGVWRQTSYMPHYCVDERAAKRTMKRDGKVGVRLPYGSVPYKDVEKIKLSPADP